MTDPSLEQVLEAYHAALNAFVQGDPEPQKSLYSRSDRATLCNPLGPPPTPSPARVGPRR